MRMVTKIPNYTKIPSSLFDAKITEPRMTNFTGHVTVEANVKAMGIMYEINRNFNRPTKFKMSGNKLLPNA